MCNASFSCLLSFVLSIVFLKHGFLSVKQCALRRILVYTCVLHLYTSSSRSHGFSKRSSRRLIISAIENETRRKIWWGVYTLDRMLALALGRPIGAEDVDCDVELPIDLDDEFLPDYFAGAPMTSETPSLMTGFLSLISLYNIAGRVMRTVYGVDMADSTIDPEKRAQLQVNVDTLDKELTKWLENLPPVFKSTMINEKQVSMGAALCTHYYSVLTALHRNLLPVRRGQPLAPQSSAKAVSSARTCIRLAPFIKNVVPLSHHLAFFIQQLFSSAVIVLLYAMRVADPVAANSAMEEVQCCLGALESWEGIWPGVQKVKEPPRPFPMTKGGDTLSQHLHEL